MIQSAVCGGEASRLAEICVLADFATSCAAALCFSVETTVQMPEHELKQGKSDD